MVETATKVGVKAAIVLLLLGAIYIYYVYTTTENLEKQCFKTPATDPGCPELKNPLQLGFPYNISPDSLDIVAFN